MIKTTAPHMQHAFSTFLWRPLHDYDDKFSVIFLNLNKTLRIQLQEKSPAFDLLNGSK